MNVTKNALKMARRWAKQGNLYMAQEFLNQAVAAGHVSDRQVLYLNKMLAEGRQRR